MTLSLLAPEDMRDQQLRKAHLMVAMAGAVSRVVILTWMVNYLIGRRRGGLVRPAAAGSGKGQQSSGQRGATRGQQRQSRPVNPPVKRATTRRRGCSSWTRRSRRCGRRGCSGSAWEWVLALVLVRAQAAAGGSRAWRRRRRTPKRVPSWWRPTHLPVSMTRWVDALPSGDKHGEG